MSEALYSVNYPPAAIAAAQPAPAPASAQQFDEGLALFITFAILFLLSTWDVTAKWAMWIAIALFALVWSAAFRSGQAKTFWQALAK